MLHFLSVFRGYGNKCGNLRLKKIAHFFSKYGRVGRDFLRFFDVFITMLP